MDEYFWPARHVAEYAYCPRLFYLMEVEGLFAPSVDTEQGKQVHQRVHKPSTMRKRVEEEQEPPGTDLRKVRGLALTSATLGLTGTLDLAELDGSRAVPVEYRKGRPRQVGVVNGDSSTAHQNGNGNDDDPPELYEPWPTDRVQVGLQVILLESAGYDVPRAVLYYAQTKQKIEVAVDDTLRQEAFATLELARRCATGARPLPLLNDPRCPKCSLQPICLPDEVNHLRGDDPQPPRKLWPPGDGGVHLVAQQEGVKIGVRGLALHVTDRDGNTARQIPLADVESLAIIGSIQLSTQALHTLAEKNIPVAFMSTAGRLIAIVDPLDSVTAAVRKAQVRELDKPERTLELARALVTSKIVNQRVLLMRNAEGLPGTIADELLLQSERAANSPSIDALRGHEGQAAALYFEHFARMLRTALADEFDRNGRQRRPPPDPVNATLSMAYTMLAHECVSALRLARLEPTIGAFHTCRPGRPALALDLMEPFRPLIADSVTLRLFNRGELDAGHFLRTPSGCVLSEHGRRAFFDAWGRRLETEVTHPVFGYRLSYRRMLMLHARMIAAWLLGEIASLSFLTTR